MGQHGDVSNSEEGSYFGFPSAADLEAAESQSSPDTGEIIPNCHSGTESVCSTVTDTIAVTPESALIAEATQRRVAIFNSDTLSSSAASNTTSNSLSNSLSPSFPLTLEYANMILGHRFKVSRCRTIQALKLSAHVKCTKYNAAAFVEETLAHDTPHFAVDMLVSTLSKRRESQRLQLLDLFGYVEPADRDADEAMRTRAPAIDPPFGVFIGINIRVGQEFYANAGVRIHDHAPVVIGRHVRLGPNVSLLTEGHAMEAEERRRGDVYAKSIEIGDDVWVGAGATVLGGVKIGNRAIIGAGALVNRDVGEGELAVGVPAKVRKRLEGADEAVGGRKDGGGAEGGVPAGVV